MVHSNIRDVGRSDSTVSVMLFNVCCHECWRLSFFSGLRTELSIHSTLDNSLPLTYVEKSNCNVRKEKILGASKTNLEKFKDSNAKNARETMKTSFSLVQAYILN